MSSLQTDNDRANEDMDVIVLIASLDILFSCLHNCRSSWCCSDHCQIHFNGLFFPIHCCELEFEKIKLSSGTAKKSRIFLLWEEENKSGNFLICRSKNSRSA